MSKQYIDWVGIDLDGTLARYSGWQGIEHIGEPIKSMVDRLLDLIAMGYTVKIFTARACTPEAVPYIKAWLAHHSLPDLEVTNIKDYGMLALYDDRAYRVEHNTGRVIGESADV